MKDIYIIQKLRVLFNDTKEPYANLDGYYMYLLYCIYCNSSHNSYIKAHNNPCNKEMYKKACQLVKTIERSVLFIDDISQVFDSDNKLLDISDINNIAKSKRYKEVWISREIKEKLLN